MRSFQHAAASRELAEAVVTRVELADGQIGWGETLPRSYVTGETADSVVSDLGRNLWPRLLDWASLQRSGALAELEAAIPVTDSAGRPMPAAACALELACLWAMTGLSDDPRTRNPIASRVSGVLGSADPAATSRRLRLMRLFGLRDYKLKLGFGEDIDAENLRVIHKQIGRGLRRGKFTLRADVNGGWDAASTPQRVAALKEFNVCLVEQPVYCSAAELASLADRCDLPLMADESLLLRADAEALLEQPKRLWWNIRLSKNGGFARSMELAMLAHENGVPFVIGCMVGESGILSAAQRRLLQFIPQPRFVEGNYGRLLLADDLTRPSLRMSYGGRLKPLADRGPGVTVDEHKLARYGMVVSTLQA